MTFKSELLDQFVSLSGDVFLLLDSHGVVTQSSDDGQEWAHKPVQDLLHVDDIESWNTALSKASHTMAAQGFEVRVLQSNGSYASFQGRLKFLAVPKTFLLTLRRLSGTEQIPAEQKNRMISSSRLAVLGEISGGIAHEINNPLTVIQARSFQLAQMAENNVFDAAKVKAAAESISKTGDKIAKIVKSLRAFAHSQDNVPVDTVSVRELVQETLDFCKVRFYNHGIDIQVGQIPEDLEVQCRLIQIEEVLLNIFNNAHDAILNLPEKWITVEAFDRDKNIEIQITDSGPGIPEKIADQIMMPFFSTKTQGRGMGLGLSIVTDIIEKHHGQIYLDRKNKTTRFIIILPKSQPK